MTIDEVRQAAARMNRLHQEVHTAFESEPHGEEHCRIAALWREAWYHSPLYDFDGDEKLTLLAAGEPMVVAEAIDFLLAQVHFYRSGYIVQKICPRLKRLALTPTQRLALLDVVEAAVFDPGVSVEFIYYARLARTIGDRNWSDYIRTMRTPESSYQRKRWEYLCRLLDQREMKHRTGDLVESDDGIREK